MKKAFTLIEVLISIFILFLGLVGIAAVFAKSTKTYVENFEYNQAFQARRSAESFYQHIDRTAYPLVNGWNVEYFTNFHSSLKIAYLTFKSEVYPPILVTACFKGQTVIEEKDHNDYQPYKGDIIVSWYGFIHRLTDENLQLQEFEKRQAVLVLPHINMEVLDIHRTDFLNFH